MRAPDAVVLAARLSSLFERSCFSDDCASLGDDMDAVAPPGGDKLSLLSLLRAALAPCGERRFDRLPLSLAVTDSGGE